MRAFAPVRAGHASIYVCGPTVQASPHIGHLRSALVYDLWRRWLSRRGLEVTLVRNVTDIDDKILAAADGSEPWWALAYRFELEFTAAYATIGVQPPSYEPHATAHLPQMLELISRLIAAGAAYPAEDDSGDVYFDTTAWTDYGQLTRQRPEEMIAGVEADSRGKRNPRDFALWKARKATEPVSANWASPWGEGRPGWHIECSAMAARYLGAEFDIHGGGLDLRFPHHENELAQSRAAGDGFARYWVHNGLVTVNGQKMSKSLGNSLYAGQLLASARPIVVRYYLAAAHYRSVLDYHDGALEEAEAALERIETFLVRVTRRLSATRFAGAGAEVLPAAFEAAMDEDLAVPSALAVLHDCVRAGNQALDDEDLAGAARLRGEVIAMTEVLGINPLSPQWQRRTASTADAALGALVERLLGDRRAAREARDFATADRIREELAAAGISLQDSPTATHWSIHGE